MGAFSWELKYYFSALNKLRTLPAVFVKESQWVSECKRNEEYWMPIKKSQKSFNHSIQIV